MIYIHVPFCKSFCTYCDFYSELACHQGVRPLDDIYREYTEELCAEIDRRRDEIEASSDPDTLYIGGGTPSVLPFCYLEKIVRRIGRGNYSEFTLEVNPEDIVSAGGGYLQQLRSLGVNRISMGIQSLDNGILKWMNRRHDSSRAEKAFRLLRDAGFGNISVDIIFGLSQMTDYILEDTVRRLTEWHPEHISAYQLTVEEGSALARIIDEGRYSEAADEQCRRQYNIICDMLRQAGYHHYEISNWALPGREAVHNSAYWTRKPYVGLGPGAHSLKGDNVRSWNSETLSAWTSEEEHLSPEEIREERLMLGLRTDKGVDGKVIPESEWFISDSIIASLL